MILVTGATGTNGVELVRELTRRGQRVRALVRDPEKAARLLPAEVELARGDLSDADSLAAAMDDVERMFLLGPVVPNSDELEGNAIDAARRSGGVGHVVKLSVWHADANDPTLFARVHGLAEQRLRDSGLAWTMLRPTFFMQNLLGSAGSIKAGAIYEPAGDGRAPHVDVRDITAVAAAALTERGHEGKSYQITGPRDLSYDDVARVFSAVLGRDVKYVDVPREAGKQSMVQAGLPDWLAEAICELNDQLKAGKLAGVSDDVPRVTGKPARSLEDFVREHAATFRV